MPPIAINDSNVSGLGTMNLGDVWIGSDGNYYMYTYAKCPYIY